MFSPRGELLASCMKHNLNEGSADKTIKFWDYKREIKEKLSHILISDFFQFSHGLEFAFNE